MIDIHNILSAGDLAALLGVAALLGCAHTILGPDHYVPFVAMARAGRWRRRKTMLVTSLCGLGHVAGSVLIGSVLAAAGMAAGEWGGSRWAAWHAVRGDLAAWLLMGLGAALALWGLMGAVRRRTHSHVHAHDDGKLHAHVHDHGSGHMHAHEDTVRRMTPWLLFTVFVFGPCESLIPLMLAAFARSGVVGMLLVSAVFGLATVLTILATTALLLRGVDRIALRGLDRWSTAIAGASLVLCGAGIRWLGL